MGKSTKTFLILAIIATLLFGAWTTVRIVKAESFDMNCHMYIHRAAGAIDTEVAMAELKTAIDYIDQNNLTDGTFIIFLFLHIDFILKICYIVFIVGTPTMTF